MHQHEIWDLTDDELIDALSAINGNDRVERMIEREALRRILARLPPTPDAKLSAQSASSANRP